MKQDLKARLRRYRDAGKTPVPLENDRSKCSVFWPGWTEAGFKTLKRELLRDVAFPVPGAFPETLPILVPDLLRIGRLPSPGELLFFDLETTGLSGGAGTIAFLAAFGSFCAQDKIRIIQYLLLDYSGESDFIDMVVKEITALPVVVSFNGKCFDSQILKNRCLMNRVGYPDYFHADLLHPARRLWKKKLPDCSQSTIETAVLGLDRSGDISGAMAPDIWFSFLREGGNRDLLSVCEHNARDISGLASLFLAVSEIAFNPLERRKKFRFNEETLAFYWRKTLRKNPKLFENTESYLLNVKTGDLLLETAARNGNPAAAVALAKNAEWRLKDYKKALEYTAFALSNSEITENFRDELEKRRIRLSGKL